jgi:membrane-associated protease RseP (regulator of RpoE activity)
VFNVIVCCFNLLPMPPLDGFHCTRLAVEMALRRNLPAHIVTPLVVVGILLLACMLLSVVWSIIRDVIVTAFS